MTRVPRPSLAICWGCVVDSHHMCYLSAATWGTETRSTLADTASTPPKGESASQSAASSVGSILVSNRDTRLGVYTSESIPFKTLEKMERHPIVYMCQRMVAAPISTAALSIDGPDPLVCEVVRANLAPIWSRLLDICAEVGAGRGCSPWEIVWARRESEVTYTEGEVEKSVLRSGWAIAKLKDLNPYADIQSIAVDGDGNFSGLNLASHLSNYASLPSEKTFLFTHQKRFGDLWGRPRLTRIYDMWYRWNLISDFYLQYLERRGTPPPVIKHPAGEDTSGNDNSVTAGTIGTALMGGDAYVTLPQEKMGADGKFDSGWGVDFLDDGQRGDMFKSALEAFNKLIARGYLVPDKLMTQEGGGGSYAMSHTHADAFLQNSDSLLGEIIHAVNMQLVPLIVRFNFPEGTKMPLIKSVGLRDDVRDATFEIVQELIKADTSIVDIARLIEDAGFTPSKAASGIERQPEGEKTKEMAYQFSEGAEETLRRVNRELALRRSDV